MQYGCSKETVVQGVSFVALRAETNILRFARDDKHFYYSLVYPWESVKCVRDFLFDK